MLCELVEHSCEVVGRALLLQRTDESNGVEEGRRYHGRFGIPYGLMRDVGELTQINCCDVLEELVHRGNALVVTIQKSDL